MTNTVRMATYDGTVVRPGSRRRPTSGERTAHTKARKQRQLARLRKESIAAKELADALDSFFYDLRFTAPECVSDRISQLGGRIAPTMLALGYPKKGRK